MRRLYLAVVAGAVAIAIGVTTPSYALQSFTGRITQLEPTYMPDTIAVMMDAGNAACPAGKWLWWASSVLGHNDIHAVYATMLAALLSGKRVNYYIVDDDVNCAGVHFQVLGQ